MRIAYLTSQLLVGCMKYCYYQNVMLCVCVCECVNVCVSEYLISTWYESVFYLIFNFCFMVLIEIV